MTEPKDSPRWEAAEEHPHHPSGSDRGSGHKGLVIGAAVLATVGTILAGVRGIDTGSLILQALALEGLLVALAAWLSLHAFRIRRRLVEAHEWQPPESGGWDEMEEEELNVTLHDVHRSRMIHFAVLAVPVTLLVGFLATYLLWTHSGGEAEWLPPDDIAAASVICLVACCLWLVLSRSFEAFRGSDVPEAPALMLAFRDLQWTTLLVAAGILGTMIWPKNVGGDGQPWSPPEIWVARLIFLWLIAVCAEQLIRIALACLRRDWMEAGFTSPTQLILREAVFVRGNPIASLFETIEARFGVSFRSSWAIGFVRAAAVPSLIAVLLLFWALTSLSVVGTDELGIRESFGQIRGQLPWNLGAVTDEPLPPGLHWKFPWPFGRILRYPVKHVFAMPVGFVPSPGRQRAFLWTTPHAEEEFALVLGNDAQVLSVNTLVYYKIREDKKGLLDYVYQCADSPEDGSEADRGRAMVKTALDAYAHRALMEQTRTATLEEILAANRAEFCDRLKQSLRNYAAENRLGIDVIDVALVGMHPPIDAAPAYLDVISAEIDAERYRIGAEGQRTASITDASTTSHAQVAAAEVQASQQVGKAHEESAEFVAMGEGYRAAPEAFMQRLWFETYEAALADQPLIVVDEDVIVDMRKLPQPQVIIPGGVP